MKSSNIGQKRFVSRERYFVEGNDDVLLGKGNEGRVRSVKIISKKRARLAAMKIHHIFSNRTFLAKSKKIWVEFKKAGLPVPKFFVPLFRQSDKNYGSILMENLKNKYGKLIPVNPPASRGFPTFLNTLLVAQDKKLIVDLAVDLAKINSLGYETHLVDFWHFYKKQNGKYDRLILDYGQLKKLNSSKAHNSSSQLLSNHFGKEEYSLFDKVYQKKFSELEGKKN